jgi:hypothetical protein
MWAAVDDDTHELILTVTEAELRTLLGVLLHPETAEIKLDLGPDRPGLRRLDAIRLALGDGSVRLGLAEDHASMTGSREAFARLAEEVEAFAEHNDLNEPGMHAHFGPAGQSYGVLGRDSVPLIITGPVPDDAPR